PQSRRRRLRDQAVRRAYAWSTREGHRQQDQSVKIRTRAYVALWLITILVAGTIGFILVAINIGASQDAERQRLTDVLNVHGSLWRTLVELKHDQHDLALTDLPTLREHLQRE